MKLDDPKCATCIFWRPATDYHGYQSVGGICQAELPPWVPVFAKRAEDRETGDTDSCSLHRPKEKP